MNSRSNYKTKNKELILDMIINYNKDFTANDIYLSLNKKVGLTTIYRMINKLLIEGSLVKIIGEDSLSYFRYLGSPDEKNQLFIKCESCGELTKIECNCYKNLQEHISRNHNFLITENHIVINGECRKCLGGRK